MSWLNEYFGKLNNQVACKARQLKHYSVIPLRSTVWSYSAGHKLDTDFEVGNEPENTYN